MNIFKKYLQSVKKLKMALEYRKKKFEIRFEKPLTYTLQWFKFQVVQV